MLRVNHLITALVCAVFLFGATQAYSGGMTCVHGHSGEFQTPGKEPASTYRYGSGLNFAIKDRKRHYDWIHYAIPTDGETFYSSVRVGFYQKGVGLLRAIHVWNASRRIATFDYLAEGVSAKGDWFKVDRLLPYARIFENGAGISLSVGSFETYSVDPTAFFNIASVCLMP